MAGIWYWVIPPLFCAPWVVAIVWAWTRRPRDGWIPPSLGEQAQQRLASR